jgi:hypothetical protein
MDRVQITLYKNSVHFKCSKPIRYSKVPVFLPPTKIYTFLCFHCILSNYDTRHEVFRISVMSPTSHKTVFCSQMIQSDNTLPAGVKSETCQQYVWPTVTYWQTIKATPQPSWLVTGFSLQVHICAKEAHMGFVVEKEALGQAFLKSPSVFPSILFPPTPYFLIHRLPQMKKSCSFHPIKTCWQYLAMVCGSHSLA